MVQCGGAGGRWLAVLRGHLLGVKKDGPLELEEKGSDADADTDAVDAVGFGFCSMVSSLSQGENLRLAFESRVVFMVVTVVFTSPMVTAMSPKSSSKSGFST